MSKGTLLYGGKAQAKIAYRLLSRENLLVSHVFDGTLDAPTFKSDAVFSNTAEGLARAIDAVSHFVVCIGGYSGAQRAAVFDMLKTRCGLRPRNVISPEALIDPSAKLEGGVQIMPGAFIGMDATVGEGSIVNSVASIDHDTCLGKAVHVMGAAAIAGEVVIEAEAGIGTNATVLPRLAVGNGAMVGAGAIVTKDVEAQAIVRGQPARKAGNCIETSDLSYFATIV